MPSPRDGETRDDPSERGMGRMNSYGDKSRDAWVARGDDSGDRHGRAPLSASRKGRLLVIDDEPQIGNTLRLLLDPDHEVVPVTSAREAIARLKAETSFDIIFCDLMMPGVSGADFYKELAAVAPEMLSRLVFMTGGVFSTQTNDFLQSVPNTCIEKPFDIAALLALINERVG
jgi:CheY-like chemotaxis protein